MQLVSFVLPAVMAILGVGWFTLLERKVLGYMMTRKGPNKVGSLGLMQPMADGVKLFCKELVLPTFSNYVPFLVCPCLAIFISLILWFIYPFSSSEGVFSCGLLFYLANSSVNVFVVLLAGWSSNSKYALLGAIRGVAQSISYEVSLALVALAGVYLSSSLMIQSMKHWQAEGVPFSLVVSGFVGIWMMSILAETNRAPFDFVEGESELVSGFNVEYSGAGFALIYMSENANILFNSLMSASLFFGASDGLLSVFGAGVFFFFIWIRGSLPRFRYDALMSLVWKSVLPLGLSSLMVVGLSVAWMSF